MKRVWIFIGIFLLSLFCVNSVFSQNSGKQLKLSPQEIKMLNTFLSNFSEVSLEPFTGENLNDKELIRFGVDHNYRNNEKLFVKSGKENQVKIKESYVDESVKKFFGRKIQKHQSAEGIEYKNGWYFIPEASGESFSFSQISDFYDNGHSIFTAMVNVYTAGSGWTGNVHGTVKEWEKTSGDDVPELTCVMKAVLHKVTEKGKSRYILLEYSKIK